MDLQRKKRSLPKLKSNQILDLQKVKSGLPKLKLDMSLNGLKMFNVGDFGPELRPNIELGFWALI